MTETEIRELAQRLLKLHGLYGWKIAFGNAVGRGGSCSYKTKTLRFSRLYIKASTAAGVRNTVTHEVAHAIAGMGAGHGPEWRRIHIRLGGTGQRTVAESQIIDPQIISREKNNYVVCLKCKTVLGKSTKKIKTVGRSHRGCGGGITNVHRNEIANA